MTIQSNSGTNGTNGVPGKAIDARPDRRPGVPMETEPKPAGAAHWAKPDRQPDPGNVLKREGLDELTPVFGTAVPPRGLSGAMRRAAYKIPEHHTSHWLVLLLADRVDAIEHHRAMRYMPIALPFVLAGGLATAAVVTRRRRRRDPIALAQAWLKRAAKKLPKKLR